MLFIHQIQTNMKKFLLATLSMVFFAAFIACNSTSTPSSAALKIVNALKEKNYDYVLDNTVKKDGTHFTKIEKSQLNALIVEKGTDEKIVKKAKVLSEEINEVGDETSVKMDVLYENDESEEVTYKMKKIDGNWQNMADK